jgi:hypothetical protein
VFDEVYILFRFNNSHDFVQWDRATMDIQVLLIINLTHLFLRIAMAHSYSKAVTLDLFLAVLYLYSSLYCISASYII